MAVYQRQQEDLLIDGTKRRKLSLHDPLSVCRFEFFHRVSARLIHGLEVGFRMARS
jgi:hypothetical protein